MNTNKSYPRRKLGTRDGGLEVSAIGLGCMGMSDFYGPADDEKSLEVLNHAVDIGIDFLDTADMYGTGRNELLLAKLLRTRRKEVVLATKFGIVRDQDTGARRGISGRPEYVQSACDASLKRLGIDHIDLYYQHRVDRSVPIEDTVGAMQRLVDVGKVRHLGLSEASADTIRRASKVAKITAVQSEYSLWTRDMEAEVLPACRELGIGFVPYSPLGRGFLTGAIRKADDLSADDYRHSSPRFNGKNLDANLVLVDAVTGLAETHHCTPGQLALAWLLHQAWDIVPIPGTRHVERLDENAGAAGVMLNPEDLVRIRGLIESADVAGMRYTDEGMRSVNA